MKRISTLALAGLAAGPALAHPGHDASPATHWVADLPHLAVTLGLAALCVVALGGFLARRRGASRRDKP
ncbi:DUF6732 family protein [Roseicyclus sp.]|uniref:DUF6732 family protein n=1 Tax=Roseicyclus sp. TaxID=1914329 RepID=UPI003FA0CB44